MKLKNTSLFPISRAHNLPKESKNLVSASLTLALSKKIAAHKTNGAPNLQDQFNSEEKNCKTTCFKNQTHQTPSSLMIRSIIAQGIEIKRDL